MVNSTEYGLQKYFSAARLPEFCGVVRLILTEILMQKGSGGGGKPLGFAYFPLPCFCCVAGVVVEMTP